MHKKPHLPEKTCPVCQRPFTWRKKWAKDWDNVRYCSERCRRARSTQPSRRQTTSFLYLINSDSAALIAFPMINHT